MKYVKWIGLLLGGLVLLAAIIGFFMPSKRLVSRSATISAPDSVLFRAVNKLDEWHNWSTWHKLDANMKIEYSQVREGVGASYKWAGNSDAGTGTIAITDVIQNKLVAYTLVFADYSPCNCRATFSPSNGKTLVTFEMDLDFENNPFKHLMGPVMANFIAKDYDACLANMQKLYGID